MLILLLTDGIKRLKQSCFIHFIFKSSLLKQFFSLLIHSSPALEVVLWFFNEEAKETVMNPV